MRPLRHAGPAVLATAAAALATTTLATTLAVAPTAAASAAVQPVSHVDLTALPGLWYQIAAIPATFESGCVKDVTASYALLPSGLLSLENDCVLADGTVRSLPGEIRVADPGENAEFEVSFTQVNGVYVFPDTPNRVVIGVDPAYRWLVVGSFDHSGGVILARTPCLTPGDMARIDGILVANGYDPSQFVPTPQD